MGRMSKHERTRQALIAAEAALIDLGACNDKECAIPNCNHALSLIRVCIMDMQQQSKGA